MQLQDWREGRRREFDRVMSEHDVPPRRARVAWGILCGFPDKDIAHQLDVTVHAVRRHKPYLYRLVGAHDRGDFVKSVMRLMRDGPPWQDARVLLRRDVPILSTLRPMRRRRESLGTRR